jgi:predicted SAM-dependent methyltransferase
MHQTLHRLANAALHTRLARSLLLAGLRLTQYRVFSPRTARLMEFDLLRLKARRRGHPDRPTQIPSKQKLHFGCGNRRVSGWLNVDVAGSEYDVDLASGRLPWADEQFVAIASQHVIEHLELQSELLPLLTELRRVAKPDCEIWLTCPDLGRICQTYADSAGQALIDDRLTREHTDIGMNGVPSQHMINNAFHQSGEHQNLFDLPLLRWALERAGFTEIERQDESAFLARFPEFPRRADDRFTIYVRAFARHRRAAPSA